jgi:hypothetical protein
MRRIQQADRFNDKSWFFHSLPRQLHNLNARPTSPCEENTPRMRSNAVVSSAGRSATLNTRKPKLELVFETPNARDARRGDE